MIDQTSQFFAILTNVGAAKLANANALGVPWKLTEMGVGDANDTDPIPSAAQTSLINEWRRRPLNQLFIDPVNPAVIVAEQVIPADEGGRWIREIALYDADRDLVAVANCPPSFKPIMSQGSGRTQIVRMNIIVSSTGNITLKIDPSVVLATREFVERRIQEELYKLDNKQSVRVATTANIALTGLQTVDGISLLAGDRVLVKNQTVSKDNGIYIVGVAAWQRAPDADSNAEVTSAMILSVEQGATLADTRWQLVTDGAIVLGTTALTFQNITQGFAPINSPALINPTANTPPQFDSSTRVQTTAFAKRMGVEYSGFAPLTASTALGVSSVGGMVVGASTTPINITLPPTAGVPDGATVEVVASGVGAVTVLAAGLDVLASPVAGVITVVLSVGDSAEFVKVSNTWRLRGGSVALKYAAVLSGPNWTSPAQFASDKSFATTEFVKRMGVEWSGFTSVSASTVLGNSSVGGIVSASSSTAINVILPPTGPVGPGAMIMVLSGGAGAVTLQASNGEQITNASSSAITIVLGQGDFAILTRLTGEWRLVGGTALLKFSNVFAAIFGSTANQVLPSGWTFKIGHASTDTATGTVPVTFPVAFPNACMYVGAIYAGASTAPNPAVCQSGIPTRTGFTGFITNVTNNAPAVTVGGYNWLAIGY
ncbi:phage tail protein [Pseudomonas viciae]|uniref:Phage tail protein n=1 Tax=Pseudomonas viciae TaxID=2505979 RepID=A0A4P7PJW1_9PSED|nr:phage tail protein [Pseudomonas viciae]QBZ91128.1 phage tail protein [Pseudomonas viciae]